MIGVEKQIYCETYLLLVKYYDSPDTFEIWEDILKDAQQLIKNYDNYVFAKDMVMLVLEQLEYRITGKVDEKHNFKRAEDWNYLVHWYLDRKKSSEDKDKRTKEALNSRLSKL